MKASEWMCTKLQKKQIKIRERCVCTRRCSGNHGLSKLLRQMQICGLTWRRRRRAMSADPVNARPQLRSKRNRFVCVRLLGSCVVGSHHLSVKSKDAQMKRKQNHVPRPTSYKCFVCVLGVGLCWFGWTGRPFIFARRTFIGNECPKKHSRTVHTNQFSH